MSEGAADLDLIREAALEAGKLAMPFFEGDKALGTQDKGGGQGPVTEADLKLDRYLRETLLEARPDYGWLSEETADDRDRLTRQRIFIVDPIDGTRAFIKGKPHFTVCIAVVEAGRPVAGIVYNPAAGELYEARKGGGAFLNGEPITVNDCPELAGMRLISQPEFIASKKWPEPWPEMTVELRNSMAYRVALVASGAWDATLAPNPKSDWDLAAADILAAEAGALITGLDGEPLRYNQERTRQPGVICGCAAIHAKLLDRVRAWPGKRR